MSDSLKAVLTSVITFAPSGRIGVVERGGIKKVLESSRFDASDIIAKILYYGLVLFVLQLAFGVSVRIRSVIC